MNKKKSNSSYPPCFIKNDERITEATDIADEFNCYFTETGPKLASAIDTSGKPPFDSYLTKPCLSSFKFEYTNPDRIEKIIGDLKPKSSAGLDNISSKILKEISDIISYPLSIIINQSLCTGIFPSRLKIAKVLPLFKKDDNRFFGNYRPISLLSSVSKIFERIAFNQLYDYFISNDLLFDGQYGFRDKHSTELAASELIDRLRNEIDNKKVPLSIFLDLSKAFDTLDHDILLSKLEYYGVKSTSLKWFASYLRGRSQYVDYDGLHSSVRSIKTGVPQGSILGPLLFIIYMNDINISSQKLNFILYADDTTLTFPLCSFTHCDDFNTDSVSDAINQELTAISNWLSVNRLSLNASKTKFMVFHNYQKIMCDDDIPKLIINDSVIERVREFNFLGLTINESLNWSSHCSKIANKISRTLGVMNRLKRYLPFSALKLMYDSLILPHLQFGITCWGFETSRIIKLQKRAMRIMTLSKYNAHTEPLFKELKLLKVKDIFDVQCMKFWHKFTNGLLPKFFRCMFRYNHEIHDIETRSHDSLHLFPTRTSGARLVLRHYIPELLQKLPDDVSRKVRTHSIDTFVSHVKTYLIDLYSYVCSVPNCFVCKT